jgi:hypothetical protein
MKARSADGLAKSVLKTNKAFVGLGGTHNPITVLHKQGRIVCQLSLWAYALVMFVTALFGPVLLTLFWLRPAGVADLSKLPWLLTALILVLPFICSVLFIYYLCNRHRIEFVRNSGDLYFYKRDTSNAFLRIGKHQISNLIIIQESYWTSAGRRPVKNFVLSILCSDDSQIGLCKTTDEGLLQSLSAEIKQALELNS